MSLQADRHLTEEEIVDVIDHGDIRLASSRRAHLARCESCATQVQELREVMLVTADVEVPEPSPLFWDHLAGRVAKAVESDAARDRRGWWPRWSLSHITTAVTTATVVLVLVLAVSPTRDVFDPSGPGATLGTDERVGPDEAGFVSPETDFTEPADWALVLRVADAVEWSDRDADILVPNRGTLQSAVFDLTLDERRVLAELLEAELEGSVPR